MSIVVPILTEFKSTGIKKAIDQFKSLESAGAKAQYAIKKAAVPAAAALATVSAGLVDAVKAAMEDQASQAELARSLEITAGATKKQIASVEDWITAQGRLLGVSDDQLRPALAKLSRSTYDIETAQKAATMAMDIAAGTGKDLDTVTTALSKAYGGNLTALQKIDPSLRDMIKGGASLADVMDVLGGKFGGAATVAANTAEGGFKRLKVALNETKEGIGTALLPVVEMALPKLQEFAQWAQDNPEVFKNVALAIGGIATATLAMNAAASANPYVLMGTAVIGLALAFQQLYEKLDQLTKIGGWVARFAGILLGGPAAASAALSGLFDKIGGGKSSPAGRRAAIPMMANGGLVTAPTVAMIGEAGPEAVIPLNRLGSMGGNQVTINVNGGDPNAVVDALRRYMNRYGNVPIRTVAP